LLAQCSYDGFFKSICQALCLYRKEADNRQDHYEELHQDSESVPDDLILVSHDDVILAIGKRKARRSCGSAGLYRRILPERLEGAGGCDGGAGFFSPALNSTPEAERRRLINHSGYPLHSRIPKGWGRIYRWLRQGSAAICKTTKRQTDVAARIGGEEFVLLLPETDEAAAETTAERLRKAIQVHTRALPGENLEVTVSIGVAGASLAMSGFEVLLKHADEALYEAKRTGRNRVVRASRTMTDQYPVAAE
jgi:hypothetical protein